MHTSTTRLRSLPAADLGGLAGIVIPDVIEAGSSSDVLVVSWVEGERAQPGAQAQLLVARAAPPGTCIVQQRAPPAALLEKCMPAAARLWSAPPPTHVRAPAGERLTDSKAADVRQLCDTLLSAYLIQLLDTGFLHADPHPGNLLRTPDGRVGILDHGLVTVGTPAQRWQAAKAGRAAGHLACRPQARQEGQRHVCAALGVASHACAPAGNGPQNPAGGGCAFPSRGAGHPPRLHPGADGVHCAPDHRRLGQPG